MLGTDAICLSAGLHGARIAIMGRRQQVIQDSAEKLKSEGVDAIGVQVLYHVPLLAAYLKLAA